MKKQLTNDENKYLVAPAKVSYFQCGAPISLWQFSRRCNAQNCGRPLEFPAPPVVSPKIVLADKKNIVININVV